MGLDNKQKLTPYWQRITAKAEEILTEDIEDLKARTVDPEYCLAESDKRLMAWRKLDLECKENILERVREGNFGSKLWALDTVASRNPFLLFRKG